MRKLWVWLTFSIICILAAVGYSAVQGDFVLNFTDAAGSTKFFRALGSSANGLVVDVSRVQTITTGTLSNVITVGTVNTLVGGSTTAADGLANTTTGVPTIAFGHAFNGTTWDRLIAGSVAGGDGVGLSNNGALFVRGHIAMYNGTTWDRVRGNATDGVQIYNGRISTAVVTMFTSTTNATTLVNSSTTRRMVHIYNEGSDILYVKLGTSPTLTSYSFKLQPEAYWEMPVTTYSGTITGLWTGATSTAAVTVY